MQNKRTDSEEEEDADYPKKNSNVLSLWGNEKTMNLNPLLLTNIQSSHYFKVNLFEYKTYHEVIDEIYYNVTHLEPWEKGSRKTGGQTGMCGGVRGVGAGGIVSTAFSCLYKLFTLKLTRKQVMGLLKHTDSPYLRGLGFMYLRYTQPPADLWTWYEPYLEDEESIDIKAGGGEEMTIGVMCRKMMVKLDWYGTLFPRIPVPIQMKLQTLLKQRFPVVAGLGDGPPSRPGSDRGERSDPAPPPAERHHRPRSVSRERHRPPPARDIAEEIAMEKDRIRRQHDTNNSGGDSRSRGRERHQPDGTNRGRDGRERSRDRRDRNDRSERGDRSERSRDYRERSRDRDSKRRRSHSKDRQERRHRSRSRSREQQRSSGSRPRQERARSRSLERRRRGRSLEHGRRRVRSRDGDRRR